jgi:mannose-6-phosphate isomerase-like protein (cupin superfamily)
VDAVGDGKRYTLRKGDLFWTGVGCVHAFYNTSKGTVRWLETQSPPLPDRHGYRFSRDWEYLKEKLAAGSTKGRGKRK